MTEPVTLLVGDTRRTEFREATDALRAGSRLVTAIDVSAAEAMLAQGLVADLIVIAQAFPGQVSADQVDRLRRLAPVARVLALLGSWCEGEMRTGKPWPGAIRVYWHQWLPHCQRELRDLVEGRCGVWALPCTAGDEERFLSLAERPVERRQGLVAIHARQYEMQDWLRDACRRRGYATVWLHGRQPAYVDGMDALVFDFAGEIDGELEELCRLVKMLSGVPVLALVNFPRAEDVARLAAHGMTRCLSKPLLLDDLYMELDRLVAPQRA